MTHKRKHVRSTDADLAAAPQALFCQSRPLNQMLLEKLK